MTTLLDYTFADVTVSNPDGTRQTSLAGATVVAGPGDTSIGHFEKAVMLNGTATTVIDLSGATPNRDSFSVTVLLSVSAAPTAAQTVLDCAELPYSLVLLPGSAGGFAVEARVRPAAGAKAGASTAFGADFSVGTWYALTLTYDSDTVALFVNGTVRSVHAYPSGALAAATAGRLTLGGADDGSARFAGSLAALRWQDGIDGALQAQLDERRTSGEWYISRKFESLSLDIGVAQTAVIFDSAAGADVQHFAQGLLMCHDGAGTAFEMHGAIWAAYSDLADVSPLGYLVSDEIASRRPGGRKSLFSGGGIYWSPATGAVPVVGHLYLDYERLGEASGIGMPTALATAVTGGLEQIFEGARMYFRTGAGAAHEVHGAILDRFLATGGTATWGFPVTDESDVLSGATSVGRFSEFDNCTFYWTAATGAHEAHGDIRAKFRSLGGPTGQLGFPTSDEGDIPGASAPARFNTFQHGSLLWFGDYAGMTVATPFQLFIGRLDTKNSEGFGMGENDLYVRLTVWQGGATLFDQRFPSSGDFGGHDIYDWNYTVPVTITPNTTDPVRFVLDVWDSDDGAPFGGGDDHLGTWDKTMTIADGWGLRENSGILNSGNFDYINDITAAVKPVVNLADLTPGQKWWGVRNQGTDPISYDEYASAFGDVDPTPEWYDPVDDLDELFYDLVVKDVAANGNCFGMSLEGIESLKGHSLFGPPLDRFTDWNTVVHEFNVKHTYQVGAAPIWWFVGEFLSVRTHAPKDVFTATAAAYARGDNPVLCIAQNADFSGAPHCIMPVAWNTSVSPWEMTVCDPNFTATTRTLTVDPVADTFHYDGGNVYDGTSSSGGRLHYMPYHLLCSQQRTPVWDAILLLLAGTVLILGSDGQTTSITDADGQDINACGPRANQIAADNGDLDGFFVPFNGFAKIAGAVGHLPVSAVENLGSVIFPHPDLPIAGELFLRRGQSIDDVVLNRKQFKPPVHLPIGILTQKLPSLAPAATHIAPGAVGSGLASATIHDLVADPSKLVQLHDDAQTVLQKVLDAESFVHTVKGSRDGTFRYVVKQGLTTMTITSPIAAGETTTVDVRRFGTSAAGVTLRAERAKTASVRVDALLGTAGDGLSLSVDSLPLGPDAELQISPKPGLGGIEVLAGGQPVEVGVTVDGVIGGRTIQQSYRVSVDGGVRIDPAGALTQSVLPVSTIGALLGPSLARTLINPTA